MIGGKLDSIMMEYNEKMKPVVNTEEVVDVDINDNVELELTGQE
jgi:hypothetical protein